MNVGISIEGIPVAEQVRCFKKLGICRTFTLSEQEDFEGAMALFRENGILCENLHAPYSGINAMWGEEEEAAQQMLARLKTAVDRCARHGIPVVVVHLSSGRPMPAINERGLRRYGELFDYAAEHGVTVALENQRYKENLFYFMERYPQVAFCWDCGHEYGVTGPVGFMDAFGHRLAALHLHDNRCGIDTDDHLLPFDGAIDFDEVAQQIARSGYTGTLMLEVVKPCFLDGEAVYDRLTDEEYVERSVQAVKKLNAMVEAYR